MESNMTTLEHPLTTQKELMAALIGVFDAAPSSGLLSGFMASLQAGVSLEAMVENWTASSEFAHVYSPSLTATAFAKQLAKNLLGDQANSDTLMLGETFLLEKLNAGVSKGQVILEAVRAIEAVPEYDQTFGKAKSQLDNKIELATHYATTKVVLKADFDQLRSITSGIDHDSAAVMARKALIDAGLTSKTQIAGLVGNEITAQMGRDVFWATAFGLLDDDDPVTSISMDSSVLQVQSPSHETNLVVANTGAGTNVSAYFDQVTAPYDPLAKTMIIEFIDTESRAYKGKDALFDNGYNHFDLLLGGQHVSLGVSGIQVKSYEDWVRLLNYSLQQQGIESIKALLGESFSIVSAADGLPYFGTEIRLDYHGTDAFVPYGLTSGDGFVISNAYNHYEVINPTETALTQAQVVFDNVGGGKQAGGFWVGGRSVDGNASTTAEKAIEKLIVTVKGDNWLSSVDTVNNGLKELILQNRLSYQEGDASVAAGALRIGSMDGKVGLVNVRVVDAHYMVGDVFLQASLGVDENGQTSSLFDKYTTLGGSQNYYPMLFDYQTGIGHDTLALTVTEKAISDRRFALSVDTSEGDDVIELSLLKTDAFLSGDWHQEQASLNNVNIQTGNGNDTVTITGEGLVSVNTGEGDDVVTFSTNSNGPKGRGVLTFTGEEQGRVTITNFNTQPGLTLDALDFRAYLDTELIPDPGVPAVLKPVRLLDTQFNTDNTAEINSVSVIRFAADLGSESAETFSGLTSAKLLNALNSADRYGDSINGINNETLNASLFPSALVGSTANYVVMVHNESNQGEYKAFYLTSNGTTDFKTASLIGVIDLLNEQTLTAENFL